MENKVLAKVGNYEVTEAELSFMLKSLNPQVASQFIGPEVEQRLLEEIINQKLLLCEAVENKFEENEDFAEEFAKLKENFISQYSVRKILESVSVSEEEAGELLLNGMLQTGKGSARLNWKGDDIGDKGLHAGSADMRRRLWEHTEETMTAALGGSRRGPESS